MARATLNVSLFSHYIRISVIIHHSVTLGQQPSRHWFLANDLLASALSVALITAVITNLSPSLATLLHQLSPSSCPDSLHCRRLCAARSLAILSREAGITCSRCFLCEKEPTRAEWNDSEMRVWVEVKRGVKEYDEDAEEKRNQIASFFVALGLGGSCRPEAAAQLGKHSWLLVGLMCTQHPIYTDLVCSFALCVHQGPFDNWKPKGVTAWFHLSTISHLDSSLVHHSLFPLVAETKDLLCRSSRI